MRCRSGLVGNRGRLDVIDITVCYHKEGNDQIATDYYPLVTIDIITTAPPPHHHRRLQ
ncbi:MAG: hypothetical protein KZQ60_06485 [Candidatus Thiodiazotropha sp. (ex Lucinoma aequizonata)]|nr:hypothetical protein [Candidatus Thiodiazotropha sp. (ex Lucinoma aequizonata)]MCU7911358.1 hypothetical protein [Candidatus Thiodiazotropha sp. (ex Lucinoma aequizonata)]